MHFRTARRRSLLAGLVLVCLLVSIGCTCASWVLKAPVEIEVLQTAPKIKDPGTIGLKRNRDVVQWKLRKGTLDIKWSDPVPEGERYDSPPPASEITCEGKTCTFVPRAKSGRFKYTITVTMPEGTPSPDPLDPDVVVMD